MLPWFGFDYATAAKTLPDTEAVNTLMPYGLPDPEDNPQSGMSQWSIAAMVAASAASGKGGRRFDPVSVSAFAELDINGKTITPCRLLLAFLQLSNWA